MVTSRRQTDLPRLDPCLSKWICENVSVCELSYAITFPTEKYIIFDITKVKSFGVEQYMAFGGFV